MPIDLSTLVTDLVSRAMKAGATAAESVARDGNEFSTSVRMGQVETLKESGGCSVGLRVFAGQRTASTYASDLSAESLDRMVKSAVELAKITSEDPNAGLPDPAELGKLTTDLKLHYDDVWELPPAERIDYARRAEKAALETDKRLGNSDSASFDCSSGKTAFANSLGFLGESRGTSCSVSAVPIAVAEDGSMQRDGWFARSRSIANLESPEAVGKEAARRALLRLGARKMPTQQVPIVYDPQMSRGLLEEVFDAITGDAVWRQASFLAGKIGLQVAGDNVTIVDDSTIPGGFGSSPFDGEGLPSRRTVVVEKGILKSYLLNTYTARKLGMRSTGNASRPVAGNPGISSGNFFLQKGEFTPQQILGDIKNGFYVTDIFGFGVNTVTGDYSQGASGLWIQNGELAFPVEEVTVAGNLKDMLRNISMIGTDLEFRGSTAAPTIRIEGMTVGGA